MAVDQAGGVADDHRISLLKAGEDLDAAVEAFAGLYQAQDGAWLERWPPEEADPTAAEDGSEAQAGETGELLVRASGPDPRRHFFNGYLKDEVATAEAWDGGWFHTGDVVRRDEHGGLYFVDRKKNVIRRSGEPPPIER